MQKRAIFKIEDLLEKNGLGDHLNLRGRERRQLQENCITKSLKPLTLQQILLRRQIKDDDTGGACGRGRRRQMLIQFL